MGYGVGSGRVATSIPRWKTNSNYGRIYLQQLPLLFYRRPGEALSDKRVYRQMMGRLREIEMLQGARRPPEISGLAYDGVCRGVSIRAHAGYFRISVCAGTSQAVHASSEPGKRAVNCGG